MQIANYRDENGKLVAQKVRTKDKKFFATGDMSGAPLYGRHLWRGNNRRIHITEGEIDALTVSQVLGHKWPVVSLPNGAGSAKTALAENLEWLNTFETVVLVFDSDEPGQKAVAECASLFPVGKCAIARLPLKDPSEMLQAGRTEELVRCLWDAEVSRPDGIVTVADVLNEVLEPPTQDLTWFLAELNDHTYGRRYGEAVALGAGTGIGKTTLITQQIAHDLKEGHPVAIFAFEQPPKETIKRIIGQQCGRTFHIPNTGWTQDELEDGLSRLIEANNLFLYDHFGACDWDNVKQRIRYLHHAKGVRIFYLDHLTALAAYEDDERKGLERIMSEIGALVQELNIWLLFVSHLATPEGKSHEEGGRVTIRHFKGSRSIGYWSHFMLGMERDQQAAVNDALTLRVLKDRYTGASTGKTYSLSYERQTGRLVPAEFSQDEFSDEGMPF